MFDMEFVSEVLQTLILALIPVLVPVLVSIAIIYWRKAKVEIQAKLSEIHAKAPVVYEALMIAARIAVEAAEQLALSGKIQEKKQFAIDFVENLLAQQGIKMDLDIISAAIESALLQTINKPLLDMATAQKLKLLEVKYGKV